MNIEDRYINAVSARLIDSMAFSVLEVEGQQGLSALVRRRGQNLELIFFAGQEGLLDFFYFHQIPRVREYMNRLRCNRAMVVNLFPGRAGSKYSPYIPQGVDDDMEVSNLWVDIEGGTVEGDTSNLKRLEVMLREYADISRLERYTPFDLKAIQRVDVDAKPIVTRWIIAINVLMWVLMTLAGGSTNIGVLIRFGAMFSPLVLRGEYWRFVTPMFLHVGLMHLAFNSYALYNLGGLAERIYGRYRFIIIYGVAGVCGSFFSFLFTRAVSAGASGAIFGLLGALLYFGRKRPGVFRRSFTTNLVTILLINLFIGFSNPGIDNFAHLGGLAGGYISARILLKRSGS